MRRLARPTGLSRGITQPQQQQQQKQQRRWESEQQTAQLRFNQKRKALSPYPQGMLLYEGSEPLKRWYPDFKLPDVVLDLDAEGSPHVRPFSVYKDAALQESKWCYDPTIDEVDKEATLIEQDMLRESGKLKAATKVPFSALRLSDVDIMAVALMDQPTNLDSDSDAPAQRHHTGTRRATKLQNDIDGNGIPRRLAKDAITTLPFMLNRRQLALEALTGKSRTREKDLHRGIARCWDLTNLKRLCSRLDRPGSGVNFSVDATDHVHARLLDFVQSGKEETSPADILRFINNMTINRLSANKELNRSMTLFGLQLASDLGLLSCILQYLQICLSMGYLTSQDKGVTLTRALVAKALLAALQRGEGTTRGTRQQIFTVLTGRGTEDSEPVPSLLGLVPQDRDSDPEIFKLSARLLGELGALRLLVHQWRQRAQYGQKGSDDVKEIIIQAFLRCAQVLSGAKGGKISVDFTSMTGDIEEDARLDMQTINAVDAVNAQRGPNVSEDSLVGFEEAFSVDDIKDAFNQPDLRAVMDRLHALIEKATEKS